MESGFFGKALPGGFRATDPDRGFLVTPVQTQGCPKIGERLVIMAEFKKRDTAFQIERKEIRRGGNHWLDTKDCAVSAPSGEKPREDLRDNRMGWALSHATRTQWRKAGFPAAAPADFALGEGLRHECHTSFDIERPVAEIGIPQDLSKLRRNSATSQLTGKSLAPCQSVSATISPTSRAQTPAPFSFSRRGATVFPRRVRAGLCRQTMR